VKATGFQRGNGQGRLQQLLLALLAFAAPGEGADLNTCEKSDLVLEAKFGYFVVMMCMLMSFVIGAIFGAAIVARMLAGPTTTLAGPGEATATTLAGAGEATATTLAEPSAATRVSGDDLVLSSGCRRERSATCASSFL
jgi:hypothetical protein